MKSAALRFFDLPTANLVREVAAGFEDAAKAIQAQAVRMNDETARIFAEQKPARNIEQERGYKAKLDAIHAEAVAILRAKGC